jgi:hypothetical protein
MTALHCSQLDSANARIMVATDADVKDARDNYTQLLLDQTIERGNFEIGASTV